MILDAVPVIPRPRPMVQLDGGRSPPPTQRPVSPGHHRNTGSSDCRPRRARDHRQHENACCRRRSTPCSTTPPGRPSPPGTVRSVAVRHVEGQQGLPPNLLASASTTRAVRHRGRPHLKLHQCGLPKQMALSCSSPRHEAARRESWPKHQVAKRRSASSPAVWTAEDVINGIRVLNRAPRSTASHTASSRSWSRARQSRSTRSCSRVQRRLRTATNAVHLPLSADPKQSRVLMLSATTS